jgi:protein translocase SEC61 complex gamma subunit
MMGIADFIREARRILKLATKPSKDEIWLSARISLLAMVLVGILAFIIQTLMAIITQDWQQSG